MLSQRLAVCSGSVAAVSSQSLLEMLCRSQVRKKCGFRFVDDPV